MEKYTTSATLQQMLLNRIIKYVASQNNHDYKCFIEGTNYRLETSNYLSVCTDYVYTSSNLRKRGVKETKVSTIRIILAQYSMFVQSIANTFVLPDNLLELIKVEREAYLKDVARKQEKEFKELAEEYLNNWDFQSFRYDEYTRAVEATDALKFLAKDGRFIFKEDLENFIRKARITAMLADI